MPEGVLVAANDAFLTLFGYSREEVIGKTSLVSGISNEESSAEVAAELNRNGRVREFECVRTTKLGDSRVLSLNLDWVSIGGIRHVLTTIRDVTGQRAAEQARQASDAKMQAILRAHPDLMFVQDRDGTYLDFYAPATSELYAAPEQFLGRRFQDVLPATAFELIAPAFSSVATSGESAAVEYQLAMPQGTRFYEARMVRLPPDKVLSIVRDLTDEKRTREELDQSKYFAQRLTETMPSVIGVLDLDQLRVLYINDHSEAITGYSAAEVIAMGNQFCARTMHPDEFRDLPRVLERFARAKDGEVLEHVIRFRHKTGGWRWIQRYGTVFARDANGRPTQVLSSGTDITKLKVVEDELRSLSARLRNTQDEERRRIARELHDGVAQSLFGMSASLTALLHSGNLPHHTANALAECAQLCDDGLKEVRLMSYVLHPPLLDDAGLVPALQWFADGLSRRSGITIEFEAAETDRQPLALEHDLFRIVQEALTNVIRHSGSPRAVVRFDHQPHQLVLQIQDFGRGMPTTFESNDGGVYATGVGILGMRERLRHLGGRLKIQSGAEGTTLTAIVPLTSDPTR
jgi:PAS domain S-box-containing protein